LLRPRDTAECLEYRIWVGSGDSKDLWQRRESIDKAMSWGQGGGRCKGGLTDRHEG
jgi:hypothetical protein